MSRLSNARKPSFILRAKSSSGVAQSRALQQAAVRGLPLKFVLQDFPSAQEREFSSFIQRAYPQMVALYGEPAPLQRGQTVAIVNSRDGGDGVYVVDPNDPDYKKILFQPYTSGELAVSDGPFAVGGQCDSACQANAVRVTPEVNRYFLLRQMLRAFRGTQLTAFDAYDVGHSDAAALILNWQLQGRPANFSPFIYDSFYLMPGYDFFNRPQLGNKVFYTPPLKAGAPSLSEGLGAIRNSMAQAAWLKVWMENPRFFALFNTRYYASNPAIVGKNAQALAAIAGSIAPMVEGLSWNDWLRRQYVLDTSVRVGEHLYTWVESYSSIESLPASFRTFAYHFNTKAGGEEVPLGGVGAVSAFDESERDITSLSAQLRANNRLVFNSNGEAEISSPATNNEVSFDSTGKPNQARITLLFRVGSATNSAFYAHNVVGNTAQLNGFYGVLNGSNSGRFTLQSNGLSTSGVVQRGAWLAPSTYASGPSVKTTFTFTDGAVRKVFRRNTAWSFYQTGASSGEPQGVGFVFEAPPSNGSITASWTIRNANKWRLISLPASPFEANDALALDIPAASLSLARYASGLRPRADLTRGFAFGITRARHTFYPATREPLGPGRAYWLKLDRDKSVTIPGGEPERAFAFDVPLLVGWNAVGVPFNLPFALGSVRVRVGEETVSWDEALARGWVGSGVWRWKPDGGYARVDLPGAVLVPLEGYFVWTSQVGAALVFDSTQRTGSQSAPIEGAGAWQIGLSVSSGSGLGVAREDGFRLGSTTFSGANPARRAAARPPWGERSVALAFLSSGNALADKSGAGNESGWAESFVPPLAGSGARWSFVVDGAKAGERVALSWGDLSTVPAGFRLFLVDESNGTRLEMTQVGVHLYAWTAATGPRRLRIEAVPRFNSIRES